MEAGKKRKKGGKREPPSISGFDAQEKKGKRREDTFVETLAQLPSG